jgi:LacI family transcriptional regulator
VDARRGAQEATRHLLEQGYERLAMIAGPSEGPGSTTFSRTETIEGFKSELHARGFVVDPEMIVAGNYRYDGGREAMEILLKLTHAPDAVFVDNDLMALGALQVAREHGLHIPEDLGIVGFDDIPGAALASIPLTTLSVPRVEIGEAIANHLLDRIADPETCPPVRRFFKTRLVVRRSSTRQRDQPSGSQTTMMKQE